MGIKAEREQAARHKAWLIEIETLSAFEIAETLLEGYANAEGCVLAEHGRRQDMDELEEEVAAYRARLVELNPNDDTP